MTIDPPSPEGIYAAIVAAQQQWLSQFARREPASTLYAADAQLLPAYSPAIGGRAAIHAFWQGCLAMGIGAVQRTPTEVDCLVDTVNELGEYRFLDQQGRVVDIGKYVVIWKQQQGRWQIHREIWTSNLPPGS